MLSCFYYKLLGISSSGIYLSSCQQLLATTINI